MYLFCIYIYIFTFFVSWINKYKFLKKVTQHIEAWCNKNTLFMYFIYVAIISWIFKV